MTRKKTTSQKHATLKQLSADTKNGIFDMLALTSEILQDHDYVDKFGGEDELIDILTKSEFAHFGGQPSLPSMIRAYRANPSQSTWETYDYNLQVMIDLSAPSKEKNTEPRSNWKALHAELEEKIASLEALVANYEKTIGEVREDNNELRGINGELRGQMKLLRREPLAI